jgi:hypothetical protein
MKKLKTFEKFTKTNESGNYYDGHETVRVLNGGGDIILVITDKNVAKKNNIEEVELSELVDMSKKYDAIGGCGTREYEILHVIDEYYDNPNVKFVYVNNDNLNTNIWRTVEKLPNYVDNQNYHNL